MSGEEQEVLKDGSRVTVRPIRPDDQELEREFIMRLSPESRHFRFLEAMAEPSDSLLNRLTHLNESTEAAYVALSASHVVGVARMSAVGDGRAEMAVTVADEWQHKGLGTSLTVRIIKLASRRGIKTLFSIDASENHAMQELATHLGFKRVINPQDSTEVVHSLDLASADVVNKRAG